jgi:hypothetical protein
LVLTGCATLLPQLWSLFRRIEKDHESTVEVIDFVEFQQHEAFILNKLLRNDSHFFYFGPSYRLSTHLKPQI